MDIRDIENVPDPAEDGMDYLEDIFRLQQELINEYVKIEKIKEPPVDVNIKSNQVLLKDFSSRVTEELAEGYESFEMMRDMNPDYAVMPSDITGPFDWTKEQIQMFKNHWQNFSEEHADALHFMVELLIYSNIGPDDISRWIDKRAEELGVNVKPILKGEGILGKAINLGKLNNSKSGIYDNKNFINLHQRFNLTREEKSYLKLKFWNANFLEDTREDLWDITCSLNIARNYLKNKPWKQTQELTNEGAYQYKLVEAFVYLCGYIAKVGCHTPWDIYQIYYCKNQVNRFRIKSKY